MRAAAIDDELLETGAWRAAAAGLSSSPGRVEPPQTQQQGGEMNGTSSDQTSGNATQSSEILLPAAVGLVFVLVLIAGALLG